MNREHAKHAKKTRPFPRELSGFAYFVYFAVSSAFYIGEKRFQVHSPDNHSPDCSPAFSIRHPPSLIWLRLAALGLGVLALKCLCYPCNQRNPRSSSFDPLIAG
jgi:hypothetical protein